MLEHALSVCLQVEQHLVDGQEKTLLVHRKGSTRAFPPHHPLIPVDYQLTGQPVLIGGTMGTHSYVLTGAHLLALEVSNLQLCASRLRNCMIHRTYKHVPHCLLWTGTCSFSASGQHDLYKFGPGCLCRVMLAAGGAGTQKGMAETFGSTCHGAGRASSRNSARRTLNYQTVGH